MISFKDFFSFRKNGFFWLNLAGMIIVLAAVCWGTLFWLDRYTHHGESYVVPDVTDKRLSEARHALESKKLKYLVVDSSYVKGSPAGIVLDQKPAAGARVKEGRTVYLIVTTTNIPQTPLPDLIDNSSMRQAEAKLKSMGFKVTEPEYVPGEQDWVYGIKYKGRKLATGDKVPDEALLTLCIGSRAMRDSLATDTTRIDIPSSDEEKPEIDDSWF